MPIVQTATELEINDINKQLLTCVLKTKEYVYNA